MPVQDTCKFSEVAVKIEGALFRTMPNMDLFRTSGQLTLKRIIQYGHNFNASDILFMS